MQIYKYKENRYLFSFDYSSFSEKRKVRKNFSYIKQIKHDNNNVRVYKKIYLTYLYKLKNIDFINRS